MLFDLDGTLSDGAAGMLVSLAEACVAVGLEVPDDEVLRGFLGPPFEEAFADHFGLAPAECSIALAAYRARYVDGGAMLEARPYPGVVALLDALRECGLTIAVATSKPEVFAAKLVRHLGLSQRLDGVFGPALEGPGSKAAVIAAACATLGLKATTTVMVGDRSHDVVGAASNAMAAIGVLWGHGSRAELEAAGAAAIVDTPSALATLLGADGALLGRGLNEPGSHASGNRS